MAIGGQERGRERVEVRNSRRPETGVRRDTGEQYMPPVTLWPSLCPDHPATLPPNPPLLPEMPLIALLPCPAELRVSIPIDNDQL